MGLRVISRNPLVIPGPGGGGGGGGGGGSGAGLLSAGSNLGEFGAGTFAGYRSGVNTGPFAVFDTGLNRLVTAADLTVYTGSLTFNGGVVFRQHITGRPNLTASTEFRQCWIEAPAGSSAKTGTYMFSSTGNDSIVLTLTDCVVDGKGQSGGDVAPYPSGYGYESINHIGQMSMHVLRSEIKGSTDIWKVQAGDYYGYSWLHGNAHYFSAAGVNTHSDRFQIDAGGRDNVTIEYCTGGTPKSVALAAGTDRNGDSGPAWSQYEPLENCGLAQLGGDWQSSATMLNFLCRFNYANDGNLMFNGGVADSAHTAGKTLASCSGLITGNRCGPHFRFSGMFNGDMKRTAADGSSFTFDGSNVIDDNFISYWGGANNGTAGSSFVKDQVMA